MKDETLERIWRSRDAIAKRCAYDPHKLVRYLQKRAEAREAEQRRSPDTKTAPAVPR